MFFRDIILRIVHRIKHCEEHKYLGLKITKSGAFKEAIKHTETYSRN